MMDTASGVAVRRDEEIRGRRGQRMDHLRSSGGRRESMGSRAGSREIWRAPPEAGSSGKS